MQKHTIYPQLFHGETHVGFLSHPDKYIMVVLCALFVNDGPMRDVLLTTLVAYHSVACEFLQLPRTFRLPYRQHPCSSWTWCVILIVPARRVQKPWPCCPSGLLRGRVAVNILSNPRENGWPKMRPRMLHPKKHRKTGDTMSNKIGPTCGHVLDRILLVRLWWRFWLLFCPHFDRVYGGPSQTVNITITHDFAHISMTE